MGFMPMMNINIYYYYHYVIKLGHSYSLKPSNLNLVMVLQLRAPATQGSCPRTEVNLSPSKCPTIHPVHPRSLKGNTHIKFLSSWLTLAAGLR